MKRALIGGFLTLTGMLGVLAVFFAAGANLVSGWSTPPGRFLTTVLETGMAPLLALSGLMLLCGLLAMGIEYFRRGE